MRTLLARHVPTRAGLALEQDCAIANNALTSKEIWNSPRRSLRGEIDTMMRFGYSSVRCRRYRRKGHEIPSTADHSGGTPGTRWCDIMFEPTALMMR